MFSRTKATYLQSMPLKKVTRKGKLDRDLPFREWKTFAIFPRRSAEWESVLFSPIRGQ
jgi:hypothetical protein